MVRLPAPSLVLALAPAALGVAVPSAFADVTLLRDVRRETTSFTERTLRFRGGERIRIQADRVRVDDLALGQSLVVRLDRGEVIHLNHLRKTASRLPFDGLAVRRAAALDGLNSARTMAEATPDAVRLDAILRGFGVFLAPPRVERRVPGEKAVIAGREAARVVVAVDGEPHYDLWMADGPAEAKAWVDALAALHAVPPAVAEALRQAPGLPLREESRYAWFLDRVRVQAEATAVDTEPVPAAEFETPAGYKPAPFAPLPDETPPEPPPPPKPEAPPASAK
jgi:hypothetical protein